MNIVLNISFAPIKIEIGLVTGGLNLKKERVRAITQKTTLTEIAKRIAHSILPTRSMLKHIFRFL